MGVKHGKMGGSVQLRLPHGRPNTSSAQSRIGIGRTDGKGSLDSSFRGRIGVGQPLYYFGSMIPCPTPPLVWRDDPVSQ